MKVCLVFIFTFGLLAFFSKSSFAQLSMESADDQARRLYERIAGVPPSTDELDQMIILIREGKTDQAAFIAMANSHFYTSTLKNMFSVLSNQDGAGDMALTDFTALAVGLVYNNKSFDQMLYGDIFYTASDEMQSYQAVFGDPPILQDINPPGMPLSRRDGQAAPAGKVRPLLEGNGSRYDDFRHYEDLESRFPNEWPSLLVERTQTEVHSYIQNGERISGGPGGIAEDIAGAISTRQWASAAFNAGTNRRGLKMVMSNFLCQDLEQLHDPNRPDLRVRQDIDRSPGGDSRGYQTQCVGCHAGMDAFAGAYAYFDYVDSRLFYNRNALSNPNNKQFRQSNVYPAGYRLVDNSWINVWSQGQNSRLGWRQPSNGQSVNLGSGARSMGMVLASTEAFGSCMVQKAFERICLRDYDDEATPNEKILLKNIARSFEAGMSEYQNYSAAGPYNLKAAFAKVSDVCFGN